MEPSRGLPARNQMREGAKAMAEYEAAQQVTRQKTARLRT